mgnify:CR=1 FL=1
MKRYILIAGVNGAGKSTLYQTLHSMQNMPRVNTDEILKEFGDWRNRSDLVKAGKLAVARIEEYFSEETSFNQETTLCGKSVINNLQKAQRRGYVIELHYVGLNSADLAKERVRFRVSHGGHGIPEELIEKRYEDSLSNLKKVLPLCDLAVIYDNTEKFRRFAIFRKGVPARVSHSVPDWYKNYVMRSGI